MFWPKLIGLIVMADWGGVLVLAGRTLWPGSRIVVLVTGFIIPMVDLPLGVFRVRGVDWGD